MANDLLKRFALSTPRENAGSRSSNRFDYQKNWAIIKILDLLQSHNDFRVIFEHHEDVVVFEFDQTGNALIDFFQIKSKSSGNWTINALVKNDKSESDSIIGKLFESYSQFPEDTRSLFFISNRPISVKLSGMNVKEIKSSIDFAECHDEVKVKFREATHSAIKNSTDYLGLSKFSLRRTDLPIEHHDIFTKGKIFEYFELNRPTNHIRSSLAHRTIFDEVRRKTNFEGPCKNEIEFLNKKTISREDFEKIIRVITFNKSADEIWNEAKEILLNEGFGVIKIKKIQTNWNEYTVDKMNSENEPIQRLSSKLRYEISKIIANQDDPSITELIDKVESNSRVETADAGYSKEKLFAAVLNEVVEYDPIQEIS